MQAWFMFDNHTFARVDLSVGRRQVIDRVTELFRKDASGSLFLKDSYGSTIEALTMHFRPTTVYEEIAAWADRALQEVSFTKLMNA